MRLISKFCSSARTAACFAAALSAFAARAETAAPQPAPPAAETGDSAIGRFAMTPVADGFLRLDTRTGQVSLCTLSAGQAQCRASADERAALEAEINRLAQENAGLKAQKPQSPQTAQKAQDDDEEHRFDRALDRAERFVRRMMQIFRDPDGKTPPTSL